MPRAPALALLVALPTLAGAFVSCPAYTDIATPAAQQLNPQRYQGFWYEVESANVFLTKGCQCTRYNFTLKSATTFDDIFTCHKGSPAAAAMALPLHGSFAPEMPGKMVESPAAVGSPPYWVLNLWGDYEYSLVYSCVPLLVAKAEYLYFFSRKPEIPAAVREEMRSFARARNISLDAVQEVPMAGCSWDAGAPAKAVEAIQV